MEKRFAGRLGVCFRLLPRSLWRGGLYQNELGQCGADHEPQPGSVRGMYTLKGQVLETPAAPLLLDVPFPQVVPSSLSASKLCEPR